VSANVFAHGGSEPHGTLGSDSKRTDHDPPHRCVSCSIARIGPVFLSRTGDPGAGGDPRHGRASHRGAPGHEGARCSPASCPSATYARKVILLGAAPPADHAGARHHGPPPVLTVSPENPPWSSACKLGHRQARAPPCRWSRRAASSAMVSIGGPGEGGHRRAAANRSSSSRVTSTASRAARGAALTCACDRLLAPVRRPETATITLKISSLPSSIAAVQIQVLLAR